MNYDWNKTKLRMKYSFQMRNSNGFCISELFKVKKMDFSYKFSRRWVLFVQIYPFKLTLCSLFSLTFHYFRKNSMPPCNFNCYTLNKIISETFFLSTHKTEVLDLREFHTSVVVHKWSYAKSLIGAIGRNIDSKVKNLSSYWWFQFEDRT